MGILRDCRNCKACSFKCTADNGFGDDICTCSKDDDRVGIACKCCNNNAEDTEPLDQNNSVEKADDSESVTEETQAPDGGWGWFIILGCLIVRMISGGIGRSHGLFFKRFVERFHQSATATAWVTSLTCTVNLASGPFVSILCNRFSERRLVLIGASILSVSLLITGFGPNLPFLYFSYGVLGGLGRSFALTPCHLLLGNYFNKRRSFAFGLASAGFSIGGFALAPLVELMLQTYGFTGTFILLSGLATHAFVSACLFRPIELHRRLSNNRGKDEVEIPLNSPNTRSVTISTRNIDTGDRSETTLNMNENGYHTNDIYGKHSDHTCPPFNKNREDGPEGMESTHREPGTAEDEPITERKRNINLPKTDNKKKKKLISLSIVKDIRFLTFLLALFFNALPSTSLFLPSLAVSRGLTEFEAAYLLSITAAFDTVFRVIAGLVLDMKMFRDKRPIIYNAMTFLQALAVFIIPSLWSFGSLALIVGIEGAAQGVKNAQRSVVMVDLLGLDKLASSMALSMAVQAAGLLLGPTISGLLKDIYGSFDGAFYFGGSAILAGAFIMAGGNIRKMYIDRQAKIEKKTCTEGST